MTGHEPFLVVGSLLKDRYLIEAEVGRGGYSVVYRAKDQQLGTTVAIKLLVPPPVAAISAKERLRREVVALQKLNHPSIIRIYDLHDDGHWSFIIMDYIDGGTLDQHVARHGPLTQEQAKEIGQHVAEALVLAHRNGILHRDVKPQNIMLTSGLHAILTDFGSAKIEGQATFTATGAIVGTLDYLAPEVFDGGRPDGRSDLYSLGVCVYFALTGKLPKGGSKHLPPPPQEEGFYPSREGISISSEFDQVIAQATMADPSGRFHTIGNLAKALSGEWKLPALSQHPSLKFCLRCGGPDLLELSVCPSCRSQADHGDTFIFLEKELEIDSRKHTRDTLQSVTGLAQNSSNLMDAINGNKSLLRVPKEAAPEIVAKLRSKQIPAYSIPLKKAFSKAPLFLRVLLLVNFSIGLWAGLFYSSLFLLLTPVFFGFTLLATKRSVFSPLIRPGAGNLTLPQDLETEVFKTLASLPTGSALDLLADIVRTGSGLYEKVKKDSLDPLFAHKLTSSIQASCEVARDLSQLDQNLLAISKHAHSHPTERKFTKLMGSYEAHRDKLVQKLLELLSTLATMQAYHGNQYESALQELEEITKELEEDSNIQLEAAAEVKEYLEAGHKEVALC